MIPSDHFVRFYNEVFKFLDERNGLEDYYLAISQQQEMHCFKLFWTKGLEGMREYWGKITIEENCERIVLENPDGNESKMTRCPSLSKALDSDAGACRKYCDHCAGWVLPLLTKCGFYSVRNHFAWDIPQCHSIITEKREVAEAYHRKWLAEAKNPEQIFSNLDEWETIEKNAMRRREQHTPEAEKQVNN
ncbi:MAG: hypothetical protein GX946_01190 [Oligosphaeraceae bacterium]|nr:hypothetical protein [Oligosphaeraceae bacterium]